MCLSTPQPVRPPAPPSQSASLAADLRTRRRMALANRTSGFGSTLLTGAAGDPSSAPTVKKTLLGA